MKDLVVRRLHVGDPIIPGGVHWPRESCLIVLAKDIKEMTKKTMLYVACFELFFVVKTKSAAISYTVNVVIWRMTKQNEISPSQQACSVLNSEPSFSEWWWSWNWSLSSGWSLIFFTWTRKCPSLWENRLLGPDKEYVFTNTHFVFTFSSLILKSVFVEIVSRPLKTMTIPKKS